MFGLDLDAWNVVMVSFLGVAAMAAVVVGLSTAIIIKLQKQSELESNERIALLVVQGDQLRKDTAEATARAAEAQLALEKFKAPRTLTAAAQGRLKATLNSFAGTIFDIGIGPMGDPEPLYLARSIHLALSAANWTQVGWTGGGQTYTEPPMPSLGVTTVSNVIVDVHPNWWPKFKDAAEAFAGALNAEGIDAVADSQPTSINTEAIHIRIGRKL